MALSLSRRAFLGSAGLAVVAGSLVSPMRARAATARAFAFAHPGILHSAADLERMRSAVAAQQQPIYAGFQALAADKGSSYDYPIQNTGQITSWGRGPSNFMNQAVADSDAVYQNALMWAVTGDVRHADKARDILNIWATTLRNITGADGQLGTGLQAFKFINAAEILRYTGYSGWSETDIARTADSFQTVWYRSLSGHALFANGNWDNCTVQTAMAVAVFCEDRMLFEESVRYAVTGAGNGRITFRAISATGQGQESGRDQSHEQLAMAMTADVAQVAWNQGIDLYAWADNRILASCEYDARYNLGNDVPFVPDLDRTGKYIKTAVSPTNRGEFQPIYEMVYAHYTRLLGIPAPYTEQVIFRGPGGTRYIEGNDTDEPSWGTLTFARPSTARAQPSAPPSAPSGLTAEATADAIGLSWAEAVEPASATKAAKYSVRKSSTVDGPYRTVAAVTSAAWTDLDVRAGNTYYYTVSAANEVGESADSIPLAITADLPKPWKATDIGAVQTPGATAFDGEHFIVDAGGADIAGTTDSFRFTYLPLHGDGEMVARLVYPVSSQYTKVGIMMRSSLDADAAHAAMLIQGLPLVAWSGVWTTRHHNGADTSATGSMPVPPSQQESITTNAGFPLSNLGTLPQSATPLPAPYSEAAGDGYRMRKPYWIRLQRKENTFAGAISPDGQNWTQVGSSRLNLGSHIYIGLAVCSCLGIPEPYAETGTAAFDNIRATGWAVPRPAGVATALSARTGASAIELSWSDLDLSARYTVSRADMNGPFRIIATDVGPVGFGVQSRYFDSTGVPGRQYRYAVAKTNIAGNGPLSADAVAAMPKPPTPTLTSASTAFANTGRQFDYLITATNNPYRFAAVGLPPGLRLDRQTGRITGIAGTTGEFRVRISATNASGAGTGELTLNVGCAPPAAWSYRDIGDYVLDERQLGIYGVAAIHAPGITSYDAGQFTVRGEGSDLNVNGQGMTGHYAYQMLAGDATLIVRVVSRNNAGTADRVGLVITKSLSPFDQMAGAVLTSTGSGNAGVQQFLLRTKVAAGTATTNGPSGVGVPIWLRLSRSGSTFTAASSIDGTTWTSLGAGSIGAFGDAPYYAGLMVCSRVPGTLNTTIFDNVSVV